MENNHKWHKVRDTTYEKNGIGSLLLGLRISPRVTEQVHRVPVTCYPLLRSDRLRFPIRGLMTGRDGDSFSDPVREYVLT